MIAFPINKFETNLNKSFLLFVMPYDVSISIALKFHNLLKLDYF